MTATGKQIRAHVINALVGMLATMFLLFGTGAWNRKENVSDHALDVQRVQATERQDLIALKNELARILDVVCDPKPNTPLPHACTDPSTTSAPGDVRLPDRP